MAQLTANPDISGIQTGTGHQLVLNSQIEKSTPPESALAHHGTGPLSDKIARDFDRVIESIPKSSANVTPLNLVEFSAVQKGDRIMIQGRPSEVVVIRNNRHGFQAGKNGRARMLVEARDISDGSRIMGMFRETDKLEVPAVKEAEQNTF